MPSQNNRFTIYDAMEKAEYFSSNPANPGSRSPADGTTLYTGPVEFPKMMYHPEGEEKIIVPAEIVMTPLGAREYNEQREMIHRIVNNQAEYEVALAEGWHEHPAAAMRVRIEAQIANSNLTDKETAILLKKIPQISSPNRVAELEAEIAKLKKLRDIATPAATPLKVAPAGSLVPEPDDDE